MLLTAHTYVLVAIITNNWNGSFRASSSLRRLVAERDPAGNQNSGSRKANVEAASFPNPIPQPSEKKDEDNIETTECAAYGVVSRTQPYNPYSVPRPQTRYPVPKQQENVYSTPRQQRETDPMSHYSVPRKASSLPPRPAPKPAPLAVQVTPTVQHTQLQTTDNIYDDDPGERHTYEPLTL